MHKTTLIAALALLALSGCARADMQGRPTVPPIVLRTAAPTADIAATVTALVQQSIPTITPTGSYTVRPGDTLTTIADSHETTVDELMAANNLSDPNRIEVGQVLRLPAVDPDATPEP